MKRKFKIPLIILSLLIVFLLVFLYVFKNFDFGNNLKILGEIKGYSYKLERRDSSLYEEHFNKLKKVLEKEEVNFKDYAKEISVLFVIDFYSLDNKVNNFDVGGNSFIDKGSLENFNQNASSTIYKHLTTVQKNKRPKVSKVNYIKVDEQEGLYKVNIRWSYKHDYDYDNEADIVVEKNGKYLYIIEFEGNKT